MVDALWGDREGEACVARVGVFGCVPLQTAKIAKICDEIGVIHDFLHGVRIAFLGNHGTRRKRFLRHCLHSAGEPVGAAANQPRLLLNEAQKRCSAVGCVGIVVENGNAVEALVAQLGFDVECANTVDFIAEKVDTVGQFVAVGKHVENGATN